MSADTFHLAAPLQFAAFEQLRRMGTERADLSIVAPAGHEQERYLMRVDQALRLEFNLVTLEAVSGSPSSQHLQAMGVMRWDRRDRRDVDGLGLMMRAFHEGVGIGDTGSAAPQPIWRVLPWLPVPGCYSPEQES